VDRTLTKQVLAGDLVMGGIQLEVSIIYSDIRGYTTLSEGMEPDRVVGMLNRYFTRMAEAIEESGGTINKFIGDALLAVFGAPEPQPDHRDRALRAALAMYRALGEFNTEQREDGGPEIAVGISVHSGLVLAGNIGTASKIEYTIIGDPVNVAQRLEELTVEKDIPLICSGAVLGPYKQRYPHESLGIVRVKGRTDTVDIYSLMPAYAKLYT
jgi:adenylate cyclase